MRTSAILYATAVWSIAAFLGACQVTHTGRTWAEAPLQEALRAFREDAYENGLVEAMLSPTSFHMAADSAFKERAVGLCVQSGRSRVVYIKRSYWEGLGEGQDADVMRLALFYHEAGHCMLNRGHVEQKERLSSLMEPIMHTADEYNEDEWPRLVKELFNPDPSLREIP